MVSLIVLGMIYLGSALMIYNIYRYILFSRNIRAKGNWEREQQLMSGPIVLLILFLLGYLAVGIFGDPDFIIAGILFGGSIFVLLMILFLEHVTKRIQANEQMEAKLNAVEESNRAKASFLSNVSHEMRTPMNAIIGLNAMALQDPTLSDKTRGHLERLQVSAHLMMVFINNILDIGRVEAAGECLQQESFSLSDLLKQIQNECENRCKGKGLTFLYCANGPIEERCVGDADKLRQILYNVLDNAIKFTEVPSENRSAENSGTVRFTVEQTASFQQHRTIRFIIEDTGIGMSEAFLPLLFQPFTKEDGSNTNRFGGSGLGMAITRELVEAMNGDIQVASQQGVGTTVTITLSFTAVPENGAETHVEVAKAPDAPSKKEFEKTELTPDASVNYSPPSELVAASTNEHQIESGSEADASDTPARLPSETLTESMHLEGVQVLLAEDVDINAEILMDLLDMEGIHSKWAENGQIAVNLFQNSEPGEFDVILMDIRMPVMDGLSAARSIRALERPDAKTIPIIALTANAFPEDVQRSLQAGMNAHLSKPVDPDLLYEELMTQLHLKTD